MKIKITLFAFVLSLIVGSSSNAYAQTNADYTAVPIPSEDYDPPQIMLSMSRDHQYFFKAYNDYTDLDPEDASDVDADGNPIVETTYKHSFDYFGYFDSNKCYTYGSGRFNPASLTANKYCSAGQWAGNFLNWATMTRMDVVRKIFYGGKRVVDTATTTVLERAFLPSDAHSFAKYYNGADLAQLTPYATTRTDTTNMGDNDGFDDLDEGITFCNTSYSATANHSQTSTAPPLIRVAEGNFQLWGSNERWQCTWDNERGDNGNSNILPSNPLTIMVNGSPVTIDSGIDASSSDPSVGDEFIARVRVCASEALIGSESCKSYPSGNIKPTGLLQTYGDGGLINFGLMTGSYNNNIRGGVLRKNSAPFSNEVNVLTDGRFNFTATSESIVRTLDSLRPWGYQYGNGTYMSGTGGADDCPFQLANVSNGDCKSWGNPISEIYKETIRYIGGLSATPAFNTDDSSLISGLRTATWNNPQDSDTQCAGLNTIVVNASVSSYDDDDTAISGVAGGINGTNTTATGSTTDTWTDMIGNASNEGLYTGQYFIGRNGTNNNEFCDGKPISALSSTFGLCPEAPTVSGSFAMAGIAYYAHNNDIRDDLDGNQTVNTFAISLATNSPVIKVPRTDGGQVVNILPAYRLLKTGEDGGGALVDFKIVEPHTRIGTGNQFYAKYYVNWEDSEQGGDYDQDMWGLIEYVLDEDIDTIAITTTAVGESTGNGQLFGFVSSGTSQDGFHAYSGIEGADYTDPTGVPGCTDCRALSEGGTGGQRGPRSHTFTLAASTTQSLESPLFYAAKYGGFNEEDDTTGIAALSAQPEKVSEWDSVNNNTGAQIPDGIPDNYFFVINPEELLNSLNRALGKILSQTPGSATSVANFANADGFANVVTQAFYQESVLDENATEVTWTGALISYFIDDFGIFREDTNGNSQLDGYAVDKPFAFDFDANDPNDPADDITELVYPTVNFSGGDLVFDADGLPDLSRDVMGNLTGTKADIDTLKTLWNAGESLQKLNNATIRNQRNYSTAVPVSNTGGSSRYIFTYIDQDLDGVVDSGEQTDFVSTNITNANFGFLGVGSTAIAMGVVDYVRGFEDAAVPLRNRTLDIDSSDVTYRLGDIVNSSPKIVGTPTQAYDTLYGDTSYTAFREKYKNRRHMVYVGANDGLLHAFNSGFKREISIGTNDFSVKYATNLSDLSPAPGVTSHPLGAEIWAYAPYNLLPHLQWLASGFYSHVFYIDGVPESYEAKIFTPDATHPNGWGTILVVGMRLGGGDFPIVLADGRTSTTRSAYVILDITDPESPPEVIAEVSHPNMNFTTAKPAMHYECGISCGNASKSDEFDGTWKLVFGSGPNNLQTYETNETAKVFTYDLETKALAEVEVTAPGSTTVANSFVGGITSRDWDNGETGSRDDDVVYFGTVGTRSLGPGLGDVETGGVYRLRPQDSNSTSLLYNADRPVSDRPLTLANEEIGNFVLGSWVYFGTGQYAHQSDETTFSQERFYGIREPVDETTLASLNSATFDASRENSDLLTYATVTQSDLLNTTSVQVRNNDDGSLGATVSTGDLLAPIAGATTFEELKTYIIDNTLGWYRELPLASTAALPSARVFSEAAFLKTQLFFTTFKPDTPLAENICVGGLGETDLYALNLTTGTASAFAAFGVSSGTAITSINIGVGSAGTPLVFTSESIGGNRAKIITQKSNIESDNTLVNTGNSKFLRTGWREIR